MKSGPDTSKWVADLKKSLIICQSSPTAFVGTAEGFVLSKESHIIFLLPLGLLKGSAVPKLPLGCCAQLWFLRSEREVEKLEIWRFSSWKCDQWSKGEELIWDWRSWSLIWKRGRWGGICLVPGVIWKVITKMMEANFVWYKKGQYP